MWVAGRAEPSGGTGGGNSGGGCEQYRLCDTPPERKSSGGTERDGELPRGM
eukprot:NODE_20015_length_818_cov_1.782923.p6 GENE.NODE_20015_length_818_cov_1.782923~~NODE_20015_length_818_cov_1.782923.p6  ORF type:complete len:51 (-),score=8.58 NODE_20015_length_818_cov_1.782923:122-274(-)